MDEYLSEKEQIEALRKWWSENGTWVIAGLVLGIAMLVGWNSWQSYVRERAEQGSALFEQLRASVDAGNLDGANAAVAELREKYAATPYADQGSLALAKLQVEQGMLDEAAQSLSTVMADSSDPQLQLVARARLAQVRLQQRRLDDAEQALDVKDPGAFAARYHELRGDIAHAREDWETARREYELALAQQGGGPVNQELIQVKIGDLPAPAPETVTDPAS